MTVLDEYKTLLKFDMKMPFNPSAVLWKAESMKCDGSFIWPLFEVRQWM